MLRYLSIIETRCSDVSCFTIKAKPCMKGGVLNRYQRSLSCYTIELNLAWAGRRGTGIYYVETRFTIVYWLVHNVLNHFTFREVSAVELSLSGPGQPVTCFSTHLFTVFNVQVPTMAFVFTSNQGTNVHVCTIATSRIVIFEQQSCLTKTSVSLWLLHCDLATRLSHKGNFIGDLLTFRCRLNAINKPIPKGWWLHAWISYADVIYSLPR